MEDVVNVRKVMLPVFLGWHQCPRLWLTMLLLVDGPGDGGSGKGLRQGSVTVTRSGRVPNVVAQIFVQ